ncbi:putative Histidine kinase [Vibrio harveyi]|uniref:sensor histidine kinase n=1 Tax=Vibrio harveyi TaxID=669 RepID=UPI002AD90800|nr:ATP-binding protein [Vibrio harveyi]CAK6716172.1 putative Histidine kinase [Vibrio harveyi]
MDDKLLELVGESMHELRVFNERLLTSTQHLGKSVKLTKIGEKEPLSCNYVHADEIRTSINNIVHLIKLSNVRMDFIDYELNPDFFSASPPYGVDLYNKFVANRITLNSTCKKHKVKITIGEKPKNLSMVNAVSLIDILPFLLLDNAVKYSPNECEVDVEFFEYSEEIEIKVKSIGPHIPQRELKRLVTKGYRGLSVRATNKVKGQGIGLYFADKIVKLHDARMELNSSEPIFTIDDTSYSEFTVTLRFPKV